MQKPIIFAIDDEPAVLAAIARDLRHEFGERFRVLRAESGAAALDSLGELKLRGEPVALLLADQRMPGMTGIDFLREALLLFPDAKRVLLTAYADTEAAIRAINEVRLDRYLMKPWDPPQDELFPAIADLLDDWQAAFPPAFEGISLIGHRWSAPAHAAKDFLARNLVPYRWLDVEESEEARVLLEAAGAGPTDLPLVLLPDGRRLLAPSPIELAEGIGLRTRPEMPFYDLVIVGAGPAGLAAAVYSASEGLRTLLVESEAPGGQAGMSSSIENYLGFPVGLSGSDLARRAVSQARRFGAEILTPLEATGIRLQDPYRFVTLSSGAEISCHAVLIATGVAYRKLEVPGADRLAGKGVFYGAAVTEAMAAAGQDVFVVGAGNSAGQAAMHLARYAGSVTMLVRGSSLAATMSRYLIAQVEASGKIAVRFRTQVACLIGEGGLEAVVVRDADSQQEETLPAHALFIFIGALPRTDWVTDVLERDPQGFILSGADLSAGQKPRGWPLARTPFWLEGSVPGIFVAGDVRHRSIKRLASAVGEGAMSVQFIHQHLSGL